MIPNLGRLSICVNGGGNPPINNHMLDKLDGFESLDTNGVMTFPIPPDFNCAGFVDELRKCTKQWFDSNFEEMLTNPPEIMKTDLELVQSKQEWDRMSVQMKKIYQNKLDLSTDEGMQLVFDKKYRDSKEWVQQMQGHKFYGKCVFYVKSGNTAMGLSNMAEAWAANGFGMWAQLVPDIGLPLLMSAMRIMEDFGLRPGLPQHFPHLIYKPTQGKKLGTHHDQMSPMELIQNLEIHLDSSDPSTSGWVRRHGCQMLAHLQGGTGKFDGATYTIGPMTPKKLYICLRGYANGEFGGNFMRWKLQPAGKIDLDWSRHIDQFNALLENHGLGPITTMAAAPGPGDTYHGDPGHMLLFPVGWPHGSFSNSKHEHLPGHGSRITVTMPITIATAAQIPSPFVLKRLEAMAVLSSAGQSPNSYALAEAWLADQTRVVRPSVIKKEQKKYADGKTHQFPWKIANLIRHPDAVVGNQPTGPFYKISAKVNTVAAYIEFLQRYSSPPAVLLPQQVYDDSEEDERREDDYEEEERREDDSEEDERREDDSEENERREDDSEENEGQVFGPFIRQPGIMESDWKRYLVTQKLLNPDLSQIPTRAKKRALEYEDGSNHNKVRRPMPVNGYKDWTRDDIAKCLEQNVLYRANLKPARLVPYTNAPTFSELSQPNNLWVLNVKQPWASALVFGVKNVENRNWRFDGSRWTLIVASGKQTKQYTEEAKVDLEKRLKQSGQDEWIGTIPIDTYQCIVGMVKLRAMSFKEFTYDEGRCSVWYNGDYVDEDYPETSKRDYALFVEEAFSFEEPIPYSKGTLSMKRFATIEHKSEGLKQALGHALAKIGSV